MPGMSSSGLPVPMSAHQFARVPGIEHQRSTFVRDWSHKTTFREGYWIPVAWDEVLPSDHHDVFANVFARLLSPLKFPIMDNIWLDWIAIYAPNRILWYNFIYQMGEQNNPGDTIDYATPVIDYDGTQCVPYDLGDYLGYPTNVIFPSNAQAPTAYLYRMYNKFGNQWSRDQDIVDQYPEHTDDGPDDPGDYPLIKRMKRADYFTSARPFAQKGDPVQLLAGGVAPVSGTGTPVNFYGTDDSSAFQDMHLVANAWAASDAGANPGFLFPGAAPHSGSTTSVFGGTHTDHTDTGYKVDGSLFTTTINDMRLAITTQQFLEIDARGGTRYPELIFNHFGSISSDARLQRVEFLGAGSVPVSVHPLAQVSASITGNPLGTLGGFATISANVRFSRAFEEHGHWMVLVCARADLSYQQGLDRACRRYTRFDYYWPVFANIGEQSVLSSELMFTNGADTNNTVFGFQEYAAEYRFHRSMITGGMRSNASGTLDFMHLSQYFNSPPTLSESFLNENPPISRVISSSVNPDQDFIFDSMWRNNTTRVMPMFSVPGLRRL